MKYIQRQLREVEATQWRGHGVTDSTPGVLYAYTENTGDGPSAFDYAYVTTKQGQQVKLNVGDYVIEEEDKSGYYPHDPVLFEKNYAPKRP